MSRERRFHVPDLDSESVVLGAEESHHLVHVLRLSKGAVVSVFDGAGRAARAEVIELGVNDVRLRILDSEPSRESPLALTVAVAPPRADKMALVVSKLTELGVLRIVPLVTERGHPPGNPERWRRIAIESCKQSGRSVVPEIVPPRSFGEMIEEAGTLLAAHPGAPPLDRDRRADRSLVVLVGSEGGWSERELALALEREVILFGLGPRVLRTETAAITAAALVQFLAGDLSERLSTR